MPPLQTHSLPPAAHLGLITTTAQPGGQYISTLPRHPSQHTRQYAHLAAPLPAQLHYSSIPSSLFPSSSGSSTETEMSDCRESASKSGSSNGDSKEFTPNQALASQAIFDIFFPFFKPDVLLMGHSRESAESLTKIISPIFWKVTQSLSVPECVILTSARQAFTDSNIANWDLHRFAFSKDRDYEVEQGMEYRYRAQARENLGVAEYDSRFDKLKQKLEHEIEALASDQKCTFEVFKAFRGLTIQVKTEADLISYLTNQTSSFCFACIEEDDFTRPLLREWFISEGAQHIETCIHILEYAVTHLEIYTAFRMMAIIYCGFKIQDATILGHCTILGRLGD